MPLPGYRLTRLRGRGGFGEVWEAEAPGDRHVALKYLPCRNSRMVVQELRTLQTLRKLEHPNLLHFDKIWCQPGYIVVAMELADGSLEDWLELHCREFGYALSPSSACGFLAQAAAALDFLNSNRLRPDGCTQSFQHCDIKPSNLLLFGDTLKVADFGLSSRISASLNGRCCGGTLDYCAPEMFRGQVSSSTDQFALAVTYCRLRSSRFPFADTPATFEIPCARLHADLEMLTGTEKPIVARALDPVPARRWTSCTTFFEALSQVAYEISGAESSRIRTRGYSY
jgi:serine/threonine protein kinase, bacterial